MLTASSCCLLGLPPQTASGAAMGHGSAMQPGSQGGSGLAQQPFLRWTDGHYLVSLGYLKAARQGPQRSWRGRFVCLQVNRKLNCFPLNANNCVRTVWRKCLKPKELRGFRDKLSLIQSSGLNLSLSNLGYNSHCGSRAEILLCN